MAKRPTKAYNIHRKLKQQPNYPTYFSVIHRWPHFAKLLFRLQEQEHFPQHFF